MNQLERIGVSLEKNLLSKFDHLIKDQGYQSRSEAIRDLVRNHLSSRKLSNPKAKAVAAVVLVYNHHSTKLAERLLTLQHSNLLQTIASMHVHLDQHDCLEVVVLQGRVSEINETADNLISLKGVKFGRINFVAKDLG